MSFDVTQQRPDRHAPICTEEARDRQPQLASAGLATKGGLRPGQGAAERSVRMRRTYQENWFQVWPLGLHFLLSRFWRLSRGESRFLFLHFDKDPELCPDVCGSSWVLSRL